MIRTRTALRSPALLLGATLCLAGAAADHDLQPPPAPSVAGPEADPDWWARALAGIEASEYHVSDTTAGLQAPNRAQNLRTFFRDGAVEIQPRTNPDEATAWRFGWRTTSWGRAGGMAPVRTGPGETDGVRVTYSGAQVSEWYENREDGLEQGFNIHERPLGSGPLRVEGRVVGDLCPDPRADGSIDFLDANDVRVLNYGALHVWDADGVELASWLEADRDVVAINVDDGTARYPLTVDPLVTSPAWTALGGQAGALFGSRLATAGDVNGDGYSDVIVGAYGYDSGFSNEGRAYLYHGSASGLASSAAWVFSGSFSSYLGNGVASAGDVNGDGYDDVVVGAPHNGASSGSAYLFLGSATGLASSAAWSYSGSQLGENLGWDVASAGDVNGDGYSDVIIGALQHNGAAGANTGRAVVFHGSPTGLAATPDWIVEGDDPGGQFGTSVSTAGDVDGDGFDDVIVGAYVHDNGETDEGRAYVYLGDSTGLFTLPAWSAEGNEANAWFGYSVSTAGDMNGDGYSDVLVGAPHKDGGGIVDSGEAYLYYGSSTGPALSPAWTGGTSRPGAEYGWSVATAGDVDGNGLADFVIGVPLYYISVGQTEGAVFFFAGSTSGITSSSITFGSQDAARFGHCVATAGDVNGDGFSDVLVGAQLHDGAFNSEGQAFLYPGEAGSPSSMSDWNNQGSQASETYGLSVASAGDVDGDGYSDLLVGSPFFDAGGLVDAGKVFLYLGSPNGPSSLASWSAVGDRASELFGVSTSSAGDVDGDGYSDVIVGAWYYTGAFTNEGAAFVYLGSPTGLSSLPAWTTTGGQTGAQHGSVAGAGDVNGDGYSDVIVGAYLYDAGQADEGRAQVYLGSSEGLSSAPDWEAFSGQAGSVFGRDVASAGDVNGDGYSDVIVAAQLFSLGQANEGAAFVYHGSPTGLSPVPDWTGQVDQANAQFGSSVGPAGDVNGDGYSDVIVGASVYDNGEQGEGAAFLHLGSAAGLETTHSWSVESDQAYAVLGSSVSTAGDVNGDGYSDVIVGAPGYDAVISREGLVSLYLGSSASLSTVAAWSVVGNASVDGLGTSVACAGDLNGDGFSDLVISAPYHDTSMPDDGAVYLFLGSGAAGRTRLPRQERIDGTAPVAPLGRSDSPDGFRVSTLASSPGGRSRVRLEVEVKPAGTPFDGAGTQISSASDAGLAGLSLTQLVTGLQEDTLYRWRARVLDDSPLFPPSRWMSVPGNALTEADLRTASSAVSVPDAPPATGPALVLAPPRPNPSAGATELRFTLPSPGAARLAVYDLAGRRVAVLTDGPHAAGPHSLRWDGTNTAGRRVASGTYFARLSFGERTETRKIVRVR